jgi:hypothetical protein
MNHFARRHRRLFSIVLLFTLLLQGFVVANASTPAAGADIAAHCADMEKGMDMDKASGGDCCSCCPEGAVMTGGCTSVCIAHCSNDAAIVDVAVADASHPISTRANEYASASQIPPTPPPISH